MRILDDSYQTIQAPVEGLYKEKGSKFISYLSPIDSVEEFEIFQSQIKKEHPKARHFCYAYKIGVSGDVFRINDDGEPSGTAGKPIFGQLESAQLTHIAAIVVRYFGGTKLGASGLIRAYKTATEDAIAQSLIKEKIIKDEIKIAFEYEHMGLVLKVLKSLGLDLYKKQFDAAPFVEIQVRKNETLHTLDAIRAKLLNRSIEDITEDTVIKYCSFEIKES